MGHYSDSLQFLKNFQQATGTTKILTSYSGGKDSLAVLQLCLEAGFECQAFFMYFLPGLECEEKLIRVAEKQLGVKVWRYQHPDNVMYLKYGMYCDITKQALALPNLRIPDIENKAREDSGIRWIASGHRKMDSLERRAMLSQCNMRDYAGQRLYPIGEWSEKEVYQYLRHRKLPVPHKFGGGQTSGINLLYVQRILWLKDNYPEDYAKILRVFPYIQAEELHQKLLAEDTAKP